MKTENILDLDCTKTENIKQINRFLWKIKPLVKILEKQGCAKTEQIPLELLEQALQGMMAHYKYQTQGINFYFEEQENKKVFVFYNVSVLRVRKTRDWIGNVYGKTLWEVVAKLLIKIYADVKKEKEKI